MFDTLTIDELHELIKLSLGVLNVLRSIFAHIHTHVHAHSIFETVGAVFLQGEMFSC